MPENQPMRNPAEIATRPRRTLGCLWIALITGSLLLVACVCFAYLSLRGASLKVSTETTYITEPLKSDGRQVDYFAAWEQETYPESIATDENGYRRIVQHLGPSPDSAPEHFAVICQKLGLDADSLVPDMTLEEPHDFLEGYLAGTESNTESIDELSSRIGRPWTLEDLPMMQGWLAENDAAIDLISEAVRQPAFCIPYARASEDDTLITVLLPDIQYVRSFARALSARANYRIGTGDIDGAIDDVVACKRLGRHVGRKTILIEMLVGIAIEGIANSIGIAGSLEHPPTKAQLDRLMSELDNLPPVGDFATAMRFERYASLDVVQAMAHGNQALSDLDMPNNLPKVGLDWNVVARRVNSHHDAMLAGATFSPPKVTPLVVASSRARSEWMADVLSSLLLPAMDAAREATRRRLCAERMHRINLAMLIYEAEHGTLPPAYTVDADGKPLHSWRVTLLPYVGEQALYDQIRREEPWDSEHNRQFHDATVAVYQCPSAALKPGKTTYAVVTGPGAAFEDEKAKKLTDFGPKSANLILVAEGTQAVCWMDPIQDIPLDVADLGIGVNDGQNGEIASPHPGGANFGLRSGGCQFLSKTTDSWVFQGLLRGTVEQLP